jgi:hypothetical protein
VEEEEPVEEAFGGGGGLFELAARFGIEGDFTGAAQLGRPVDA